MQSSPDIRGALGNLSRHYRVHNPNARISASEDEGFAAFGVGVLGAVADYDQLVDLALAAALNIMQAMCGDEWHPTEVRFAHACPEDLAPYRFFGSPMHFDQRESALIFPAYWLDRAPRGADRLLNRMMAHTVSGIEASAVEDLVARVHRMLPAMVFDGKASLAAVAIHLGLGTRTLNRRLAEGGSSFAELRERACHAIARQFLEGTTMAAGEIAALLGYAHSSAFTRAFRRWSGMSPVQWRAAHHRRTGRPDTAKASDAATPVDRHQAGAPSTDSGGS
jgi:AraC-like DNA-binding protein